MRNIAKLGFVGIFILLGGCAAHYSTNDAQVDLYLSTLEDKHFVWCELDLEQCRHDFEKWKLTPRGQMIIREFEPKSGSWNLCEVNNTLCGGGHEDFSRSQRRSPSG